MASEHPLDKPTAIGRKPARSLPQAPYPTPQTGSPLHNNGQELVRDSNC